MNGGCLSMCSPETLHPTERPLPRSKSPQDSGPRQGEGWGAGCPATRWESSGQRPDRSPCRARDSVETEGSFLRIACLFPFLGLALEQDLPSKQRQALGAGGLGPPDPWCPLLGEVGSLEVEVWGALPHPTPPCESEAVGAASHWGPGVAKGTMCGRRSCFLRLQL